MKVELSEQFDSVQTMFILDIKGRYIAEIDVIASSESGETVETTSGKRLRTDTKSHKVFYHYDFALLGLKQLLNQFDSEYDEICKRLKLRRKPIDQ